MSRVKLRWSTSAASMMRGTERVDIDVDELAAECA
jgi:hypothetical protein